MFKYHYIIDSNRFNQYHERKEQSELSEQSTGITELSNQIENSILHDQKYKKYSDIRSKKENKQSHVRHSQTTEVKTEIENVINSINMNDDHSTVIASGRSMKRKMNKAVQRNHDIEEMPKFVDIDLKNGIENKKEKSYYISMKVDGKRCSVKASGLANRGHFTIPMSPYRFPSDEECNERNAVVDWKMISSDIKFRQNYESSKEKKEGKTQCDICPSDHVSNNHVIQTYKKIHTREVDVINGLINRMKDISCFHNTITRYINMTNELKRTTPLKEYKVQLLREQGLFEKVISNGKWITVRRKPKASKECEEFLIEMSPALSSQRIKDAREKFENERYYSSYYDKSVCDGCEYPKSGKHIHPYNVDNNTILIRKYIGDREVSENEINTNENRM